MSAWVMVPLPAPEDEEDLELLAAGYDESKHERWPKGTPGGKGGEFKPKDDPLYYQDWGKDTGPDPAHWRGGVTEGEPVKARMGEPVPVGGPVTFEQLEERLRKEEEEGRARARAREEDARALDGATGSDRDPNWEGPQLHPKDAIFRGARFDMVENSDNAWDAMTNPAMQYDIDTDVWSDALGDDLDEYRADVEEMMRHIGEEGELRTTGTFEALESIMEDEPRFKSQFETASSGGVFSPPIRAAQEEMFFGYPQDLPAEQRPIYGWLDHPDGREDYDQYGEVTWLFKPELRARTTVSFMDSLSRPIVPGPLRNPGWRATPPPGYQDPGMHHNVITDHRYETGLFDGDAIETQYHGGVTLDDVQGVRVTSASWGSWTAGDYEKLRRWKKQLAQRGIVMEVVDENGEVPGDMDGS